MGASVFQLFSVYLGTEAFLPQLLFTLAVYGPLLGFLISVRTRVKSNVKSKYVLMAALIPITAIIPGFILSLALGFFDAGGLKTGAVFISIALYLISNIITSGTEEFGWRGCLYPALKEKGASFWSITVKSGFSWALWHYPMMIMMYRGQSAAVIIPTLIGFTAGIIAMTYISNLIYEKTSSIGLLMLMHALNNTVSFALILLFPKTPLTFLSSVMAWIIVAVLEKKQVLKEETKAE
jgi:membrane protease YdiL (CAAX protease family)